MEELITYFNVQIMGLKPFHLNLVKTPLLVFGVVGFLWATLVKSSETQLDTFIRFCRGWSYKRTILLLSAGLAGGLLWLSLLQFYSFLSAGYDLSIYSNAIWHTAHGQWFFDSVKNEHLLGDHFGPILAILAPLYWIWESPIWLLIVQSIAIGAGALAVGVGTYHLTNSVPTVLVLLLFYGSNPYLHSIGALDFHPIVLAIPIFLWLLYCLETNRPWPAMVLAGVSLLVEESLPPGLVGIGVYLVLFKPMYRRLGAAFVVIGSLWFLAEATLFLPHFSQRSLIHWDRYENLGTDFRTALYHLVSNPTLLITEAFVSHGKIFYLAALLLSVGFLPIFAWRQACLMALPALMMLLSGHEGQYKFGFHYSAVVLPFLFHASMHGVANLLSADRGDGTPWWVTTRSCVALVLAVFVANVYQVRWSKLSHVDWDHVRSIERVLAVIPADAAVRAEGNMLATLSSRHKIAPIHDVIEENFAWWSPEYFVFDHAHVQGNPAYASAREALRARLMKEGQYELVKEADGVLAYRLVATKP